MLAVMPQRCSELFLLCQASSPICKHPLFTESRLYSDPEQEVISYPTSASAFLFQVVNDPGTRLSDQGKGVMEELVSLC